MKVRYWVDNDKATRKLGAPPDGEKEWPIHPTVKHRGTWGDAGIDLFAPHDFVVPPHSYYVLDTFVGFSFDPGEAAIVMPRGGDVFLVGSGLIDTGYTGTIHVRIVNPYSTELSFSRGDSVGQLVRFRKADVDGIDLVLGAPPSPSQKKRGNIGRILSESP